MNNFYGVELIIDIHKCDIETFTRPSITQYFDRLCNLIEMEAHDFYFWDYENDPEGYAEAPDHLKGTSAIQFITTSNITIHTLDKLKTAYINIFSCKDFNPHLVKVFSANWFQGEIVKSEVIDRI